MAEPETALTIFRRNEALSDLTTFEVMPKIFELAKYIAGTDFVPKALRNNPPAVAAAMLTGHELGFSPMASLQQIHVIEGRPSVSAAGQRALILAAGHAIWVEEANATRATVCGRRKGEDRVLSMTWTQDDVKRAGLSGKPNHQHFPKQMLIARATGDVGRGAFMDVLSGIPYNAEELEDLEPGGAPPALPEATTSTAPAAEPRRRRAARAATAPAESASEPPPAPDPEPGGEPEDQAGEEPPEGPDPTPGPAPAEGEPASAAGAETAAPAPSATAAEPAAGVKAEGEQLSLAQQVAILCRELEIERADLLFAVTGKRSGREVTRAQAVEVLEAARAISRGEKSLVNVDEQGWQLLPVEDGWE